MNGIDSSKDFYYDGQYWTPQKPALELLHKRFEINMKLEALNAALYSALKSVEWKGAIVAGQRTCPCCGNSEKEGHAKRCEIHDALTKQPEGRR